MGVQYVCTPLKQHIVNRHEFSCTAQVVEFLKLWQLPECGQRTLPLMHKLKALAGIVEPRNASKRLADRPGRVCACVYVM